MRRAWGGKRAVGPGVRAPWGVLPVTAPQPQAACVQASASVPDLLLPPGPQSGPTKVGRPWRRGQAEDPARPGGEDPVRLGGQDRLAPGRPGSALATAQASPGLPGPPLHPSLTFAVRPGTSVHLRPPHMRSYCPLPPRDGHLHGAGASALLMAVPSRPWAGD